MSEKNTFKVRLMRWGDSSSSGRTVTLKLPDDTEEHPFKGLSVGSRNGQLMEMEITLLEGDAELETMGPKKRTPKFPVAARGTGGSATGALTDQSGADGAAGGGGSTVPGGGGGGSSSGGPGSGSGSGTGGAGSGGAGSNGGAGGADGGAGGAGGGAGGAGVGAGGAGGGAGGVGGGAGGAGGGAGGAGGGAGGAGGGAGGAGGGDSDSDDPAGAVSAGGADGSAVSEAVETDPLGSGVVIVGEPRGEEATSSVAGAATDGAEINESAGAGGGLGGGQGMGMGPGVGNGMGGGFGGGQGMGMGGGGGGGGIAADGANMERYADHMSHAAEALAAVAERMDGAGSAQNDEPQIQTVIQEEKEDDMDPGEKAVIRATDLCKAIDKQRAGFFYYMMSKYPSVPSLEPESGTWSRDAKATRDRLCHHCDTSALGGLADSTKARRKFEELEKEFERHDRIR